MIDERVAEAIASYEAGREIANVGATDVVVVEGGVGPTGRLYLQGFSKLQTAELQWY